MNVLGRFRVLKQCYELWFCYNIREEQGPGILKRPAGECHPALREVPCRRRAVFRHASSCSKLFSAAAELCRHKALGHRNRRQEKRGVTFSSLRRRASSEASCNRCSVLRGPASESKPAFLDEIRSRAGTLDAEARYAALVSDPGGWVWATVKHAFSEEGMQFLSVYGVLFR